MDEGKAGMNNLDSDISTKAGAQATDPAEKAERLEKDIEDIRDNLGNLVGELDHRRKEAFDIRLQLRRHPWPLAIGAVAVVGLVAGGLIWRHARRPRYPRLAKRWRDVRQAVALAAGRARPEPSPRTRAKVSVPKQIAAAAGASLASVVARRLAERFVRRPDQSPTR
jgi:ElaB/YqjD/DUF883 family membrane-anchored ribosome-binding protein